MLLNFRAIRIVTHKNQGYLTGYWQYYFVLTYHSSCNLASCLASVLIRACRDHPWCNSKWFWPPTHTSQFLTAVCTDQLRKNTYVHLIPSATHTAVCKQKQDNVRFVPGNTVTLTVLGSLHGHIVKCCNYRTKAAPSITYRQFVFWNYQRSMVSASNNELRCVDFVT
jgi:hypothetical protein